MRVLVPNTGEHTISSLLTPAEWETLKGLIVNGKSTLDLRVSGSNIIYTFLPEALDANTCHTLDIGDFYLLEVKDIRTVQELYKFRAASATTTYLKIGLVP